MANPTNDIIEFQVPEAAVQSEQKVNDFLFASGTASYASPSLTLNFTHQMVNRNRKFRDYRDYNNDYCDTQSSFDVQYQTKVHVTCPLHIP